LRVFPLVMAKLGLLVHIWDLNLETWRCLKIKLCSHAPKFAHITQLSCLFFSFWVLGFRV
jgi:hypothetical protein